MSSSSVGRIARRIALAALLAGVPLLAALAVWTRHLALEAERDSPELGHTITVDGADLHYVARGEGRSVVLVHGAFGSLRDFTATVFDPLSRRYHAIAIDRPGHGYSDRIDDACTPLAQARIVHEVLERLGVERPLLVGFSWGGTLALDYALEYPREVAGVVTLNAVSHPWPGGTSPLYVLPPIPILGPLFTHTLVMPLGRWLARASIERSFEPERVPLSYSSTSVALALRPASYAANAQDIRALEDSVRERCARYKEITVPLVIVVAEGDEIVTPEIHSHTLHREVAGSEMISVPHAGHQLLYAHPKVVMDAIDRAWELVDRRDGAPSRSDSASK
jgi:pimeloyl-ACP methyl ester carboxylesterase